MEATALVARARCLSNLIKRSLEGGEEDWILVVDEVSVREDDV